MTGPDRVPAQAAPGASVEPEAAAGPEAGAWPDAGAGPDAGAEPEAAAGREPGDRVAEAKRRKRRAAVFGEVLPEGTRDERGDGWGDRDGGGSDDWLRGQVPPHHG